VSKVTTILPTVSKITYNNRVPNKDTFMTVSNLSQTARVEMWAMDLVDALEANYNKSYPDSPRPVKFETSVGRKYIKIIQVDGGVHAFIDKKTGEVYKPASWKAPAKHVRYDLRIITQRQECLARADWAGGYLYIR
jgi:hypothetical protein